MRMILTRSKMHILLPLAAGAAAIAIAGCGGDDGGSETADGGGATVVATTTHIADLARNVAGDRGEVIGMLATNTDPHDYEPRPSDAEALADADLVLESGGDLDLWMDDAVAASGSDATVVTVLDIVDTIEGGHAHGDEDHAEEGEGEHAEGAKGEHAGEGEEEHAEDGEHAEDEEGEHAGEGEEEHGETEGDEHGEEGEAESAEDDHAEEGGDEHGDDADAHGDDEVDPHWWQSPANAVLAVEAIRDALIEVDPDGAAEYEENAASYVDELEELDGAIATCLEAIPEDDRKLVTSHGALGYFADRYGIEVVGSAIPALTTQAQPSAGETAELVELIRDEGVAAVFPEAGVNSDLEAAIAGDAGATIGGELWADTLGPEGSGGETYVEAMAANADEIARGLSGGERGC